MRRPFVLVVLSVAAGCGSEIALPTLADFPPEPRVAACLTPYDAARGDAGGAYTVAGTVIEQGRDDAPEECFRGAGVIGRGPVAPERASTSTWYRVAGDDGTSFVTGLLMEEAKPPPIATGDRLVLTLTRPPDPPSRAWYLLARPDGEVLAWVSHNAPAIPAAVRLDVAPGRLAGREHQGCATLEIWDALVHFVTLRAVIDFHWVGSLKDMRVVNAGYVVPVRETPGCAEPGALDHQFLVGGTLVPPRP